MNFDFDIVILAAGKQKRFNSNIPKILSRLKNNETILTHNLRIINKLCPTCNVNLIVDKSNKKYFKRYRSINLFCINGGRGSGGDFLKALKYTKSKNVLLMWGDAVIIDKNLFRLFLKIFMSYINYVDIIIPLVKEKNPYTHFILDDVYSIGGVFFKGSKIFKYKRFKNGWHDQSIFVMQKKNIIKYLLKFDAQFKEFEFLDIFNLINRPKNTAAVFYNKITESFNTLKELEEIKK